MNWTIDKPTWPTRHDDNLTSDQILDVLDQVNSHYADAVTSLADTQIPQTTTSSEEQAHG